MFGWFREKIASRSHGDEEFDRAMAATEEFMTKTRSIRQQLEPYKVADDPFAAIQRATSFDGLY